MSKLWHFLVCVVHKWCMHPLAQHLWIWGLNYFLYTVDKMLIVSTKCYLQHFFTSIVLNSPIVHMILVKLFELKCVLAVCTQPPYNGKNPPCVFFFFLISPVSYQAILRCLSVWRHTYPGLSHYCWLTLAFYLRPALSELSSVRHCFDARAGVDKNGS